MALLRIDNEYYYTNFNLFKLNKDKKYKIRRYTSEEEVKYNNSY